ncbi:hypothetical protein EDF74_2018 [Stenotrophomonas rhizophila]|uniref:hypothetical protein n=1 Tax=Stenotrophomonas rhizophila TaxID=216778 RepID=UPI000F9F8540|nr:hypothetical protein [Stenotrophomonas rhizophila]ROP76365.1 hypothetical protein EDF74_2018 [Stenotrophomonas rhizophila]
MKDSSTRHLFNLVLAAKEMSGNHSYVEGWKKIFNAPSSLETFRKIGLIHLLIDSAAQEILHADSTQIPAVNHWRGQLYSALATGAQRNWNEFRSLIDDPTVNYLRMQAAIVELTSPQLSVNSEELERARVLLVDVAEELRQSNLPLAIKIALTKRIQLLICAIDDYAITGNERIFDQFKATIYDVAASGDSRSEVVTKKFSDAMEIIANVVSSASGLQQLAAPVMRLLGLGKDP